VVCGTVGSVWVQIKADIVEEVFDTMGTAVECSRTFGVV